MHGAPHEGGRRAGTENVPGIVGMGAAARRAASGIAERRSAMTALASELESRLLEIEGTIVNGRGDGRMPEWSRLPSDRGSSVVLTAAREGLCLSAGSACSAAQFGGSHVLEAMGLRYERLLGAVRYSMSAENTRDEVALAVDVTRRAVDKLDRSIPHAAAAASDPTKTFVDASPGGFSGGRVGRGSRRCVAARLKGRAPFRRERWGMIRFSSDSRCSWRPRTSS
jgi:cysteine desulfurase